MILIWPFFYQRVPYRGITLWPFIILFHKKHQEDKHLIYHEKIHLRQQLELLIVPFYLWYFLEFLYHYHQLKDWNLAYYAISFEKEAYLKESDWGYLKNRIFWAHLNFTGGKKSV